MPICSKCGATMEWTVMDYDRDICYECLKKEAQSMLDMIDAYPYTQRNKRIEHKDILDWLMGVAAEHYGFKW